jgi:DNA repair exonuclease SbcCD ATPase subunit
MTISRAAMLMSIALAPGCGRSATPSADSGKTGKPVPGRNWTPEEIGKDPVGYLQDQDRRAEKQIQERNDRLGQVRAHRAQVSRRGDELATNLAEIQNVHDRLQRALRRAEEEDRWPISMAGRSFTREKANAILASCEQYVQDRRQLADAYEQTARKLEGLEAQVTRQLQDLSRLRERIGLDIERVRLNQGLAELGELQRTETEVASFSKMLGTMDENLLSSMAAAPTTEPQRVDVDAMLK